MKNIFKFGFFALLLSMAGCSDATDIIQDNELPEEDAFVEVKHLESGLNGVYAAYGPDFGGNGDGDAILFNDLFTDNIKRGLAGNGHGASEYNFILQPNTTAPVSIWGNRYATINRINRVLRAYDRIYDGLPDGDDGENTDESATDDDLEDKVSAQRIKGQLLAMRALCHLDLFEYFTPDYNNAAGLSVIVMDFVPELYDTFERNTVAEVLTSINGDLDQASELIQGANAGNRFFMNENVIKAINTRMALVSGDYATAETLATELLGIYPLSSPAVYQSMFSQTQAAGEAIFTLRRTVNDNGVAGLYYANSVSADGSPIFEVSRELYELFAPGDVRRDVIVAPTSAGTDPSEPVNNGILLVGKYPGVAAGGGELVNDVIIFRASEMQLILAECQARRGDLTGAAATIQALRANRFAFGLTPEDVYTTENEALAAVLLERRKEFAFEGHRYLDLKRLGQELGLGIDRLPSDAQTFGAPTTLPAGDHRFTLPIPQSELNANSIITQNPGYPENN